MPFLILQVNFHTSDDFCEWRLLNLLVYKHNKEKCKQIGGLDRIPVSACGRVVVARSRSVVLPGFSGFLHRKRVSFITGYIGKVTFDRTQ